MCDEDHRGRGADPQRQLDLRELRQAEQEDPARDDHVGGVDRRPGAARRHHRRPSRHQARGQADAARDRQSGRAPREGARLHAVGDRDPRGREAHPLPGSRSRWRRPRRSTTSTSRCARSRRSSARRTSSRTRSRSSRRRSSRRRCRRRPGEGREGAQEAQDDVADVRRGDRRAQLHRLDHLAARGTSTPRTSSTSPTPRRSSRRITTASRR